MNNMILTLISLSISGSILAALVFALRPILKNKVSKTFQYYIWLLVLLRLVLPMSFDDSIMDHIFYQTGITQVPAASNSQNLSNQGYITPQNQTNTHEIMGTSPDITDPNLSAVPEPARFNVWKFASDNLIYIWLIGAALYFSWFIIAYLRFSNKIKQTSVIPNPIDIAVFEKLRGNMKVQLKCSPYINTPMAIGFLSPCIMIPHLAFAKNGMEGELKNILRHELMHYRRRDLLYKWFAVLVSALHWFNPMMILIRREISRTCELSCDEAVIRSLNESQRQDYGETLISIASDKRLPTGIVTTTMCEGKRELKERLESIMNFKSRNVLMVALSLVLALSLAGCSVALGAVKVSQIPIEASQSPSVTDTPDISATPDVVTLQTPGPTDSPAATKTPDTEASGTPTKTKAPDASASAPEPSSDSKSTIAKVLSGDPVLESYKAILQNKAKFYSTDNKKNLYLKDFLSNKELYGTIFKATHFAVLDMDGDKVPEVVIELSVGSDPEFYEVLHNTSNTVNGYLVVYRGLEELKADGTFSFSNGAADNGWGKIKFGSDKYTTDSLAYSQSNQGDSDVTVSYFINNKQVSKESFDSAYNQQSAKKDAAWYKFS